MKDETQIPTINDTILQSMYSVIELAVSYANKPIYIACPTQTDYDRVITKIRRDYEIDTYILAACEHSFNPIEDSIIIDKTHYRKQILLNL